MHPEFLPQKELTTGMVGYILTNMKTSSDVTHNKITPSKIYSQMTLFL